jgi:phosphoenolpyruvate carboxylase
MEQPRARKPSSLAAVFERLAAAGFGIEAIAEVLGRSLQGFSRRRRDALEPEHGGLSNARLRDVIGSRPASRRASRRIEDLRAIPWSFSWGQARITLPGWFGFGSAVEAFVKGAPEERMALLTRMNGEWPFFRALLDMVLAKADMGIAKRYTELVPDRALAAKVFGVLENEWRRTTKALDTIQGTTERLADNPALARSIRHRFPYIAPLNHLQIELLRRWRGGEEADRTLRTILISINGVAAGLRNSG